MPGARLERGDSPERREGKAAGAGVATSQSTQRGERGRFEQKDAKYAKRRGERDFTTEARRPFGKLRAGKEERRAQSPQ